MSRPLVLVAAGGLAAEVVEAARAGAAGQLLGVLDDDPARLGDDVCGVPVLGGLDRLVELRQSTPDLAVVVCAGRGAAREQIVGRLAAQQGGPPRYASVVHPSVAVPGSVEIGTGSILLAGVVLTARVSVGQHVVVMPGAVLTHDDVVDDYATICAGVVLGGSVRIGSRAYLGMASSVRERVVVGQDAVIGMGAGVLHHVRPATTVVGTPARCLSGVADGVRP